MQESVQQRHEVDPEDWGDYILTSDGARIDAGQTEWIESDTVMEIRQ